jgi:hypothetical protein
MTHVDKGKYFQKHPQQTIVNEDLKQEIRKRVKDNNISCAAAEKISQNKKVTMNEIGVAIDLLNVNIIKCQLGLFGYEGKKKLVQAAEEVAPDLQQSIGAKLSGGRLPCAAAWEIALQLNMPRIRVSAAGEKLKIKIKPCQLGAF